MLAVRIEAAWVLDGDRAT